MRLKLVSTLLFFNICLPIALHAQTETIVGEDLVFEESNGILAVEAEYFFKQSMSDVRQWYIYSKDVWPKVGRDHDDPHCEGASNNAYIEILPDTRVTHGDVLTVGESFAPDQGQMAVLHYKININTPGRYYVWARAYSTGSEDNGIHVGIDGNWPANGKQMQWCEGKKSWRWESKQRTDANHCGEAYLIYLDIEEKGEHEIMFSMREDGFEFDKFILTTNRDYRPEGDGDVVKVHKGTLPEAFPLVERDLATKRSLIGAINEELSWINVYKSTSFSTVGSEFEIENSYLRLKDNATKASALIMHTAKYRPHDDKYDVVFIGLGDKSGQSEFEVEIDGKVLGTFTPPLGKTEYEESSEYCKVWNDVWVKTGAIIKVSAKTEEAMAKWAGLVLVRKSPGEKVLEAIDDNANLPGEFMADVVEAPVATELSGELKTWHKLTLTFDGPEVSETDEYNPFMNYRLNVTFKHEETGKEYLVPGYFAADGNAGNSSATGGNKWRVHFAPDETGRWLYTVNFRKGNYVAVSDKPTSSQSGKYMDQTIGAFTIEETDKTGRDFRSKGMLQYIGERYLKFAGTGEYFLKVGADAPENMLAYEEFDGTFHNDGHKDGLVKTWEAHEQHWNEGDPTWQDGKGKDIIGAVNYLASKGLNAFSFLTNNIAGDDQNVFPYIDYDTYDRFDCSKLDQWEVLFEHADKLGMFLHFKLMEVENQGLLDNGGVGANTKLYYRELIARFGHHLALNWNLCEENGDWVKNNRTPPQFTWQRLSMAGYFADHDPYGHHIVIHNGNPFDDLLGTFSPLTGASVQTHRADFGHVHEAVLHWINASAEAGKQWAVACDEPGDASHSLVPDSEDAEHNNARMNGLWGTFMAGGWGTEWYFGYKHPHSDLTCQDYATRDLFWDQGKIALDFFHDNNIPFWEMASHDSLVNTKGDYCFAKPGEIYVVFVKDGSVSTTIDLSAVEGKFEVLWFNPRTGGGLLQSTVKTVKSKSDVVLGSSPVKDGKDWVALLRRKE